MKRAGKDNDSAKLTKRGTITIPAQIRRRLGLRAGDRVDLIVASANRVILRKALTGENPFAKYAGILGDFPGAIEEINAWVRELRDDDR